MKSKMVLSLVMAAAVTLGGAAIATNANFNATAVSNGNVITMGTVALQSDNGQVGQTINLGTLFNVTGLGTLSNGVQQTKSMTIRGNLPVMLSLGGLVENGKYDKIAPSNIDAPDGVISTWWRHYKMAITVSVDRQSGKTGNGVTTVSSRPITVQDGYDSIFDTIEGTDHNPVTDNTTGLNQLLEKLGTLYPGDVVTITTNSKFVQTASNGSDGFYTLTQDEVNAFQGQSLVINLSLVATEAQ